MTAPRPRGDPTARSVTGYRDRMDAPPPALAVVNPGSKALRGEERRAALELDVRAAVRARTGAELEWADGDRASVGTALDAAVARRAPIVVAVGGDGTIRLAAERLVGTGIPLAVIPAGTGNLFSGALGLPIDRAAAIRAIAEGRDRAIDAGSVEWTLREVGGGPTVASGAGTFVVACGSGFDARVMAAADEGAKRSVGRAAYFAAAASLVPGLSVNPHRIEIDGDVHEVPALAVLVVNAGELIPGLVAPRLPIAATDGLLDVLVVRATGVVGGIVGALELLARTNVGWSATGASLRLRGRHVSVTSEPPEVIEVDGDVLGRGSFSADILPGALRVIVPRQG
jgi:diacylglycerol kinase (ATP)